MKRFITEKLIKWKDSKVIHFLKNLSDKSTNHNSLTKYNTKNDNDGKIVNIPLHFIEYINELNLN